MVIFVSGGGTEVGKTYITLQLMEELSRRGYRVVGAKPIETGTAQLPPGKSDGELLLAQTHRLNPDAQSLQLSDISPFRFELPSAPVVAGKVEIGRVVETIEWLKGFGDIVVVEGAGGLLVPVTEEFKMVDFIPLLSASPLLVFDSRLGILNTFLLTKFYLEKNQIPFVWGVNLRGEEYWEITHPYLKRFNPLFFQTDISKIVDALLKIDPVKEGK
ncbi:MAG: dethiobiotin synthase [Epsilonproteobacteria bacterium]|jgi:dethiobiotin synthetase|nr:dethiobiotin synthase [Campylobacterota bacterium]NPA89226.1 dethiobiotin synthase [Campylobacterota bacterium]